jgi:hypothetical protein
MGGGRSQSLWRAPPTEAIAAPWPRPSGQLAIGNFARCISGL